MSNVTIAKGSTVSVVKGAPATYDAAGYDALTFVKVGEITSLSPFGGTATVTTNIPLETGIVDKHIGSIDYGQLALTIAADSADAGQLLLKAGFDGADKGLEYSIELSLATSTGTNVIRYTSAKISSFETDVSDADSIIMVNSNLELIKSVIAGV